MSLDGYIAGPRGESDWIVMDPEIDFAAMMSRFDAVLMGRKSFEAVQAQYGAAPATPGTQSIVISRTLRPADHPGVTIIASNLKERIDELRRRPGKDIWLFGGGELFRSMLEQKLVDAVEVAVVPVLLGGGFPLLPAPAERAKLKLIGQRTYKASGIVALEYAVV